MRAGERKKGRKRREVLLAASGPSGAAQPLPLSTVWCRLLPPRAAHLAGHARAAAPSHWITGFQGRLSLGVSSETSGPVR